MEFTKQLPDTTDFGELIDNNCIYVDKTAIINQFASKKGPFFISRPRRFGKSTLINQKSLFLELCFLDLLLTFRNYHVLRECMTLVRSHQ